jgi:hypothetical protein
VSDVLKAGGLRPPVGAWQGDAVPPLSCFLPDGSIGAPLPRAILSGSFNPWHDGHRTLAAVVERWLSAPVHYELSRANVDKPELDESEVQRRIAQFSGAAPIWVTRAPTFAEKAKLFPGAAFAVGFDTAVRMLDPKYAGSEAGRDAALRTILECECRVIVGGRIDAGGTFREWSYAGAFAELFEGIREAEFRVDLSSTELRRVLAGGV